MISAKSQCVTSHCTPCSVLSAEDLSAPSGKGRRSQVDQSSLLLSLSVHPGAWLDEGERLCTWYRQDVWATHVLFTSCIGWRHILKSSLDIMLKIPPSQERITQQQLSWRQEMRVYFHTDLIL